MSPNVTCRHTCPFLGKLEANTSGLSYHCQLPALGFELLPSPLHDVTRSNFWGEQAHPGCSPCIMNHAKITFCFFEVILIFNCMCVYM